jgi:hypothetical protein
LFCGTDVKVWKAALAGFCLRLGKSVYLRRQWRVRDKSARANSPQPQSGSPLGGADRGKMVEIDR